MKKKLNLENQKQPSLYEIIKILSLIDLEVEEEKIDNGIKKYFK